MPFTSRNGLSVYVRTGDVSVASSSIHLAPRHGISKGREGRHVISHIDRILLLIRKREEGRRGGETRFKDERGVGRVCQEHWLVKQFSATRKKGEKGLWEPNLIPRENGGKGGDKLFSALVLLRPTFFGKSEKFFPSRILLELQRRRGRNWGLLQKEKIFFFPHSYEGGERAQKMEEEEEAPLRKASLDGKEREG